MPKPKSKAVPAALTPARSVTRARVPHATTGSVVLQARVDAEFARELLEHDAAVLGLDGASDVVREGLRLLHRHAQEQAMASAYDEFYGGEVAPLPTGVEPADTD